MITLLIVVLGLSGLPVKASSLDVAPNNALPEVIRQSASSAVRVANEHSAAEIQQETIANASSTLSNTSFSDIENDNLTLALQLKYRERKKQERLSLIRNQILSRLHMNQQPNISSAMFSEDEQSKIVNFMERLQDLKSAQADDSSTPRSLNAIQWLQSFYPSCSPPNNTDKGPWEQPGTLRIFYDIPFSRFPPQVTVMTAKLRLYKTIENVDPNFVGFDPNRPRYNALEGLINSRAANGISVNIYQFFKPLRTNKREKKRLVDSQTVSIDYKGWVEFNLFTPLNYWHRHGNRNYGLDVEVEDAFGNRLNPNLHFLNMNCSSEVHRDTPFPNVMEIHEGEVSQNDSSLFDNETFPTLDLRTAEIPHETDEVKILTDGFGEHVMRKRSSDNDTCRKELEYVSFSDVGLDEYILWPQGVLWTFCDGSCGSTENTPENLEYFFSSWFQRLLKLKRKAMSDCTVVRRESLPVIIYDGENQVLETVLEDFVPISCGCRAS